MLQGFGEIACLGQCKNGQPKHPLYLSSKLKPQPLVGFPSTVKTKP